MWVTDNFGVNLKLYMERDSDRQKKRDSAKKHRDQNVYNQKTIRIREAQLEKKKSCAAQGSRK